MQHYRFINRAKLNNFISWRDEVRGYIKDYHQKYGIFIFKNKTALIGLCKSYKMLIRLCNVIDVFKLHYKEHYTKHTNNHDIDLDCYRRFIEHVSKGEPL